MIRIMVALMFLLALEAILAAANEGDKASPLPKPRGLEMSLGDALGKRRSVRRFAADRPLERAQIGALLWAMSGINRPDAEHPRGGKRTAPLAYGSCAVDIVITSAEGTFTYSPEKHALRPFGELAEKDLRARLVRSEWVRQAPMLVILVAHLNRYPEQVTASDRRDYSFADAAVMAQNHYLACAALGIGTVLTMDAREDAEKTLELDEHGKVVLVMPVGYEE